MKLLHHALDALAIAAVMTLQAWVVAYTWAAFPARIFSLPTLTVIQVMGCIMMIDLIRFVPDRYEQTADQERRENSNLYLCAMRAIAMVAGYAIVRLLVWIETSHISVQVTW